MTRAGSRWTRSTNEKISVSIVVPTYEERVNVALLYLLIRESERAYGDARGRWEIIVVDDASPDDTQGVVKRLREVYDDELLVLKPREGKLGLGSAYVYAL